MDGRLSFLTVVSESAPSPSASAGPPLLPLLLQQMTSAQEAADLQAAMDASAMDVPNKPAAAAAAAGPAAVSASASGAAGPPAIVFHPVTDMAQFKTQINGALKRLQDGSTQHKRTEQQRRATRD